MLVLFNKKQMQWRCNHWRRTCFWRFGIALHW